MKRFMVDSGALRATDPCYTLDVWCGGTLSNVKNGEWGADVVISDERDWGVRVAELQIGWLDENGKPPIITKWEEVEGTFGVDSGQFGFFDQAYFLAHLHERTYGEPGFYKDCCDATTGSSSADGWGIVGGVGVVSSSGFGDGSYPVVVGRNADDEIIAARVVYISNLDDEEDEDSEEENDDEGVDNAEE